MMRLHKWLWVALVFSFAPLFFNCHRPVDLALNPPLAEPSLEPATALADAPGQSEKLRQKIELKDSSLVLSKTAYTGNAKAAEHRGASPGATVRQGLRLAATIDNSCLAERREKNQLHAKTSMGAPEPLSLSEELAAASGAAPISSLAEQSYSFVTLNEVDVGELSARAELDDCVLRIQDDERVKIKLPAPEPVARTMGTSNDPGLSLQKHLPAINATAAWDVFYSAGGGISGTVVVAIVDTGVDYGHEDLAANMWTDSLGNHGTDIENIDSDPMDDNGHGTHVAGLVGAVHNNSKGVSGVAGRNIKLMAVKVTNAEGDAFPSVIANGIRWAADKGADVINLSLGLFGPSTALRDAVSYAIDRGAVVVCAAGNETLELTSATANFLSPASYAIELPGALAVASIDSETGALSSFSNYSSTYVQIAAPGSTDIVSTFLANDYRSSSGTSMATPVVAGAAALAIGYLKTKNADATPAEVANMILASARSSSDLDGKVARGATLDLERLAEYLHRRYGVASDGGTDSPF